MVGPHVLPLSQPSPISRGIKAQSLPPEERRQAFLFGKCEISERTNFNRSASVYRAGSVNGENPKIFVKTAQEWFSEVRIVLCF
ncbi:MAG: hypothetical protein ACAH88_19340 [Roseimicrobium sp.]